MLEKVQKKGTLLHSWWECKLVQPLWKTVRRVLRKPVTISSSNPTAGHIPRWNYNSKRYMYPYVHSSIIHNSQDMETIYTSIDRRRDKDVVLISNGILLSHKKNEIRSSAATRIQLEILMLSEAVRKRNTNTMWFTYMWNLKYGTSEPVYKTETDSWHREQTYGCQRDERKERDGVGVWD